ncbi:MAG: hypothetical protein DWP97_03245 [Calditrichaeota bacterium]|nr:MAG: hypothetical protein DWP97_03245 [Calditrichota bacterium]
MCKLNKNVFLVLALFVMMIALGTPTAVHAQDVAAGSATATVQTPLTVTATAALVFGTIFQGVSASVPETDANAGVFTITGQGTAGISIYLQLPDYMSTASGDDRMVISFSSTDCAIDTTSNVDPTVAATGWTDQNPYNLPSGVIIGGTSGQTALFLGGSVNPSVDQTAGAYTADIILTVAYNGA